MTDKQGPKLPDTPDELIEWIAQRHGRSRAESARWRGLLEVCRRMMVESRRRKEEALHDAIDALERARRYEESEDRWLRVVTWCARRVDDMQHRISRRSRLHTRIDFTQETIEEEIQPTDIDESEGIEW